MSLVLWSICYIVLAALVVVLSVKLADYVDLIDKKTDISGAFIGGVVLAAVTSLPELFTSFSAVVIVKNPSLVIGNILGSNLFNMTIFGILMFIWAKNFSKAMVGKSHFKITMFSLFLFALMFLAVILGLDYSIFSISIYSLIIIITYIISIRYMANDDSDNDEKTNNPLTIKQIAVRFVILAVILVGVSISITYVTDILAEGFNLGATIAGALFLGIATSLPELTSTFALAKKSNFNAATGNILGSGVFNFTILAVSDILYRNGSVFKSKGSGSLVVFGFIATFITGLCLFLKNRKSDKDTNFSVFYRIMGALIVLCYILFIVLS